MNHKFKILCIIFGFFISLTVFTSHASEVEIKNICYELNDNDKTANVTGCSVSDINIPATIRYNNKVYNVVGISKYAFCDNDVVTDFLRSLGERCTIDKHTHVTIQTITLPQSLLYIGEYAFAGCSELKSITIPQSVVFIGEGAFSFCVNLQSINIPSSVTTMKKYAFTACVGLRQATISTGISDIENYTFSCCSSLKIVVLPTTLKRIGIGAFAACSKLNDIDFPRGLKEICRDAFMGCSDLVVNIPPRISIVGENAFYGVKRVVR